MTRYIISDQTGFATIAEILPKARYQHMFVILSGKRSRRISVPLASSALYESQRCFDFAQHDRIAFEFANHRHAAANRLDQTAFAKIAEITARGALYQVDGELEQTNFPRVVYALYDRAERFVFVFDLPPGAIDHRVD